MSFFAGPFTQFTWPRGLWRHKEAENTDWVSIIQLCRPEHEIKLPMAYTSNEDTDQPAHPYRLIRAFAVRPKSLVIRTASCKRPHHIARMHKLIGVSAPRACSKVSFLRYSSYWARIVHLLCKQMLGIWGQHLMSMPPTKCENAQ